MHPQRMATSMIPNIVGIMNRNAADNIGAHCPISMAYRDVAKTRRDARNARALSLYLLVLAALRRSLMLFRDRTTRCPGMPLK